MEFAGHSRIVRAEEAAKLANKEKDRENTKMRRDLSKLQEEVEVLRAVIEQYKLNIAEKDNEVQQTANEMRERLKVKEQTVQRLRRRDRDRDQQSDMKMSKSLSVDHTLLTNKLKASQASLGSIVGCMMELKESADRSSRLLGRVNLAAKDIYYAQ
jgi:chromosome segregation ATPase